MENVTQMNHRTVFSDCRRYRYCLWRQWKDLLSPGPMRYVQWIALNPSTADETLDDPTIRRCIAFSKAWGYSAMCMTNIFAWRDTDPEKMKLVDDPVGPDNNQWLTVIAEDAGVIVAGWGNHGLHRKRNEQVIDLIPNLQCLWINETTRQPKHPLYLKGNLKPFPYQG
jgi:hypothetical protein